MMPRTSIERPPQRLGAGRPRLSLVLLASAPLLAACTAEVPARVDLLPGHYPNRLAEGDTFASALVLHPMTAATPRAARAVARAVDTAERLGTAGDAHMASLPAEATRAEVTGDVSFRDIDGDGLADAVARFAVEELRAAGLLGGEQHELEVRIEGENSVWVGHDRLFESGAALVVLPEPTGPFEVGTAALLGFDATRPGNTPEGRGLLLRLWYPAGSSEQQPAPYFLDPEHAERNQRAAYLPLPPDLFARTHTFARENVAVAEGGPWPLLVLSTGWGAPVDEYGALAEELASHGYLVAGVNHPNGSGSVVYPDGSGPDLDPAAIDPDEGNNLDWARDLEHVARWLSEEPAAAAAASLDPAAFAPVRAALAHLDPSRIAALGHCFGGAAAVRAAAESSVIRAAANLDGPVLGDPSALARRARALILTSPLHAGGDAGVDAFLAAAGSTSRGFEIAGTDYANYADTSWLFAEALAAAPDLGPEGYQLGAIAPARAHAIVTTYLRAFFEAALDGTPSALLEGPSQDFPEVGPRP